MPYEIASSGAPLSHRLVLDGRRSLTVCGVEDVERFDENAIVMNTCEGVLVIAGQNLHIGKLSLDGGELRVDGLVESLAYEDTSVQAGGFWQRLFG